MNRGTMRTLLAKRLQDTGGDQFDTSDLNNLLNVGLALIQAEILSIRKAAFAEVSTFSVVSGQSRYANPEGWLGDFSVEVVDAAQSSGWRTLKPIPMTHEVSGDSVQSYSYLGNWLVLKPTPSVSVTDGVRRTWVPTLTMDDDADVPAVAPMLHSCIVDFAVLEALAESDEAGEATRKRLSVKLERVQDLYGSPTVGALFGLSPSVVR